MSSSADAPAPAPLTSATAYAGLRRVIREHPVATVGGTWAGVLALTIGWVWTRRIPLQLKIIQGRIVAQGALLSGCIVAAASAALFEPPRGSLKRDAGALQMAALATTAGAGFDGRRDAPGSFDARARAATPHALPLA